MSCPPALGQPHLVEFTLVGGRQHGCRIEVSASTTEVHLHGCTYRRGDGLTFTHVDHEEPYT
jgi:hypothetical protein